MEDFVVQLSSGEEKVRQVIEPLLDSEGFELVKIKLKKAQAKSLLALFIDTKAQRNGIVMENLQDISRLMSDVLDAAFAEDAVLKSRYDLEVSSPGLDRPLSKVSHFNDAIGERLKMRLKSSDSVGLKNIVGSLSLVQEDSVVLVLDNKENIAINFVDIADANIVFDFSELDKNKKKLTKK
jgi:ribosome maturation factor RimP